MNYSQRKQYQYSKNSPPFQCIEACYPHFHYFHFHFMDNPAVCAYVVHISTKCCEIREMLFTPLKQE
jgi:hypothetical protein